jgi:hypothetical protein
LSYRFKDKKSLIISKDFSCLVAACPRWAEKCINDAKILQADLSAFHSLTGRDHSANWGDRVIEAAGQYQGLGEEFMKVSFTSKQNPLSARACRQENH